MSRTTRTSDPVLADLNRYLAMVDYHDAVVRHGEALVGAFPEMCGGMNEEELFQAAERDMQDRNLELLIQVLGATRTC